MDSELTPPAKHAVRAYMWRLIALPGVVLAIGSFVLGFLIKDVAQSEAKFVAGEEMRRELMDTLNDINKDLRSFAAKAAEEQFKAQATLSQIQLLEEQAKRIDLELKGVKTFKDSQDFVRDVSGLLKRDPTFREDLVGAAFAAGAISECRVCFQESEGSSQCQMNRNTCSGWSKSPSWSSPFRDDTDNRGGGCKYQWKMECR